MFGAMVGVVGTLVFQRLKEEHDSDPEALTDAIEHKLGKLEGKDGATPRRRKSPAKQPS